MTVPIDRETAPPALLADRYELQERLDAGGMAEVWLARDTLLARPVAVKLLDRRLAADPRLVDQFKREAQSAAILNHPNIVAIYDWGRVDAAEARGEETYFLVMEYVPGSNLKDLVRRRGALPEATALRLADQVAAALEAAHQHGIVHCDVKPHNVLLDGHGRPKVADFGLACALGLAEGEPGEVVGSAHYLAPERISRGVVDPRGDIYSLGAVLFELLTGHVPFEGDSVQAVVRRHLDEPAASPRAHVAAVSPLSEEIVLRCLAKDPADRFASATDMREALGEAQSALLASLELTQPLPAVTGSRAAPGGRAPSPARAGVAAATTGAGRFAGGLSSATGAAAASTRNLIARSRGRAWWLLPALAVLLLAVVAAQLRGPAGSAASGSERPTAVAGAQATPTGRPATSLSISAVTAPKPTAAGPCQFVLGFKQLRDKIPDVAGDCVENEHSDARSGDTIQRTSKGTFVWSKDDRISRFTDGSRTWIDGPHGLQIRGNNERFRWELGLP